MLEIKRAKVRFLLLLLSNIDIMGLKYLSIFDKRGEKMARKEFETLTPQMFYILLSLYEPICGLEIMEKVNEMTEGDVRVGAGTLYALLPRFENIGYIQLLKEENKRKIYIITQKGKERLELEKEKMQKQVILFMKKDYEDEI
jgi:DNA-binding PadR family transcriptional regulator